MKLPFKQLLVQSRDITLIDLDVEHILGWTVFQSL